LASMVCDPTAGTKCMNRRSRISPGPLRRGMGPGGTCVREGRVSGPPGFKLKRPQERRDLGPSIPIACVRGLG
jgi:hypothetical protein